MKKTLLLLSLTLHGIHSYGQRSIIPPSPTATAMAKYGDIPVKLFVGTPDINVPVYTITDRDLSVPIILNYLATGIKVEEIASWVGLNWSISAGGAITRSIRGLPDENISFGYFNGIDDITAVVNKPKSAWTTADMEIMEKVAGGQRDAAPDIFYFNFPGYSGQFVFDHNQIARTIPYKNIKIKKGTLGAQGIKSFTIIAEDGTKFYFGEKDGRSAIDYTTTESECDQNFISTTAANTSWYLLKIESVTGNVMDFYYDSSYILDYTNENASASIVYQVFAWFREWSFNKNCFSTYTVGGKHLSKIESNKEIVDFNSFADREDVAGDLRLEEITVKSKIDNKLIKRFVLDHSYYNPNGLMAAKRLKLDSLTEYGKDGSSNPPYRFEYNASHSLPSRHSKAQDHWGYFNGQNSNNKSDVGMVPKTVLARNFARGGDRETYQQYLKAGILEKVTYPTGGYTEFFYESNMVDAQAGDLTTLECSVNPNCIKITQRAVTNCAPASHTLCKDSIVVFKVDAISNIVPATIHVNFNSSMMPQNVPKNECDAELTLTDSQGNALSVRNKQNQGITQSGWTCASFGAPYSYSKIYTVNLVNGETYILSAFRGLEGVTSSISVSYNLEREEDVPLFKPVGGLRIKKIINHDNMNPEKNMVREYEYSKGRLITRVQYFSEYRHANGNVFEIASSRSQVALGTAQGSHICYTTVTEKFGANAINGEVVYNFSYHPDNNYPAMISVSFLPRISNDWKRGLLLDRTVKRADLKNLNKTINTYEINETRNKNAIEWYVVGDKSKHLRSKFHPQISSRYEIATLKYNSEWIYRKAEETISYESHDETNLLKVTTNFKYDNSSHAQMTSQSTIDSQGRTLKTNFKYPLDYATPGAIVSEMINKNMVSVPIEQTQWVNNILVAGTATKYKTENRIIVPEKIYLIETTSGLTSINESPDGESFDANFKEKEDHIYDSIGNLIQLRKTDSISTSYVWGYNNTLPVAQIIGSNFETAKNVLGGNEGLANLQSDDGDVLRTTLDALRSDTSLKGALVTTYTYHPLVGMTSQTDPNGITTFYEYDELGRLKLIKDHEGNILQHYEYHFMMKVSD